MRKTKLDILIISKDYPPKIGGVATHVDYLARGIASLRRPNKPRILPYFVHVLTLNDDMREGLRDMREGLRPNLIVHKCKPDREGSFGESDNVPLGSAIEYWMKQYWRYGFHPDIVHAHDYQSALAGALLKRAYGAKLIVTIHRAPKRPDITLPKWNVKECFLTLLHHSVIHDSKEREISVPLVDCFVSPSQYCRKGLLESGFDKERIKLIPHGIPIDGLCGIHNNYKATEGLNAPAKAKVIFCPARIDQHKGLREFVDAAAILNKTFTNLYFVVAGGSTNTDEARDLLSDLRELANKKEVGNLQFGHTGEARDFTPKEMPTLYRRASICVLPSHTENYPLVLLEAQVFQCPVVATDVGGIPELITNGKTGLLFERGKTKELVDRISVLLYNDPYRQDIVNAASATLPQHGNARKMAEEYVKLYQNLTDIRLKK